MSVKHFTRLLLVILLASINLALGSTYFVDASDGDDGWDGLVGTYAGGTNGPWQSLGRVESQNLLPGDDVLLQRGETWTNVLLVQDAGATGNPITFGAYDAGAKPIIDALGVEDNAIEVHTSYLRFRDIELRNTFSDGLAIAVEGGCREIVIERLVITNSGHNGLLINKGGSGVSIDSVEIYDVSNSGIVLAGSISNKLSNVVVENCRIEGVGSNDGITIHEDSGGNMAGTNFIFRNNHAEGCAEQGYDITTGSGVLLEDNTSFGNGDGSILVDDPATDVLIRRHHSLSEPTGSGGAILISASNVTVIHCILEDSSSVSNSAHFMRIRGGSEHVEVLNNLFIMRNAGTCQSPVDFTGVADHITLKNNLFYCLQDGIKRAIRFLEPTRPPDHPTFVVDYNFYGGISTDDDRLFYSAHTGDLYTFAEFQAAFGQETNGIAGDPRLIDAAGGDFRLGPGSPAIDAGADVGLLEDRAGNPIKHEPDMGVFESGYLDPTTVFKFTRKAPARHEVRRTL